MELLLYNTLTRKKEVFKPINKKKVLLYTCGPTVYNYAHIGNLRTYVFEDVLKRTLLHNNYDVYHVMNITDVGHLTSDADSGEDKMEMGAKREKKTAWEIAARYTDAFKEDIKKLNILFPDLWCKATEYIEEQIDMITILEEKRFTYKTKDGVYFDTSKLADYGKLARLKKEGLKAGKRIDVGNKKNTTDFALWKFSPPGEKRQMEWDSPWGKGFPGWHIECSAMSIEELARHFDIHCGGIDHIPVHHSNEIAQSEAFLGDNKPWVNYWMHGEFLVLEKEKMAKSSGSFITLQTIEEKKVNPLAYRYFCFTAHYRSQLTFSYEALEAAQNAYKKLKEIIKELQQTKKKGKGIKNYEEKFHQAINDDLDMPKALAVIWEMARDQKSAKEDKYQTFVEFDRVLGLNLSASQEEKIPSEIQKLAKERWQAKVKKNWEKADQLRKEIEEKGFEVRDQKESYEITRKG